jgi:anti-sigma-K factor RskA
MRYNNPELIERLASEYVVGTLAGKARQRFERLMMESYKVRQAVYTWEEQLYPMNQTIAEQKPSPQVWKHIENRIAPPSSALSQTEDDHWWSSLLFWRSTGMFTTLAASLLIMLLVVQTAKSVPDHVAIVNNQEAQPLWLISSDLKTGQIAVKAVNAKAADRKTPPCRVSPEPPSPLRGR